MGACDSPAAGGWRGCEQVPPSLPRPPAADGCERESQVQARQNRAQRTWRVSTTVRVGHRGERLSERALPWVSQENGRWRLGCSRVSVAEAVEFLVTAAEAAEAEFTFLMEHLEQLVSLKTLTAEQPQFK